MRETTNKISRVSQSLWALLVFCLILFPMFLQARELGEQEVRAAVETWVRHITADARIDAVIERMEPHKVKGKTVAYIAHLMGGGFCLCGADDLVLPVYFYSPQGSYDPQSPGCQYILWEISTRLENLTKGIREKVPSLLQYQTALSDRALFWQNLIAGRIPPRREYKGARAEPESLELDLTCQWHQRSPYNDQCPVLTPGSDEHAVVGCVATAMSQIMYYWQWPNTGQGTGSTVYKYWWRNNWDEEPLSNDPGIDSVVWVGRLEWTSANGGRLRMNGYWDLCHYNRAKGIDSTAEYQNALENLFNRLTEDFTNYWADFGATAYQWNLMEDKHTDPPDAGDAAVATLCYHAGAAVNMGYGTCLSVAWVHPNVENALTNNFRYDPAVAYDKPPDINKMTEEIQWLRPIVLEGTSTIGHAWVVFGYNKGTDPNRQFNMNMGWGGNSDGWYSLDSIPGGFNEQQGHVARIAPKDVVKFVGDDDPGDGSPDSPYEDIEEAIGEAPDGATLIFKAGSVNTFSASTLVIGRPFTLKGKDVTIRK